MSRALSGPQESVRVAAMMCLATLENGDAVEVQEYVSLVAAARRHGMLEHPAVVAAARRWRAWLHPRGKDGRFIRKFAFVNIFADPKADASSRRTPRRRAKITNLTPRGATVEYYENGKPAGPMPDRGFPTFIPADDITGKIALAPRHVARLDLSKADLSAVDERVTYESLPDYRAALTRAEWEQKFDDFAKSLTDNPIPHKPMPDTGTALPPSVLDSAEWQEHTSYVDAVVARAHAAGLSSTDAFRDSDGYWSDEALEMFMDVVDEQLEKVQAGIDPETGKPRRYAKEHKSLILGGLPGAGKSSILRRPEHRQYGAGSYVVVDTDSFKEKLSERGLIPKLPGLSDAEASSLVHSQASEMSYMYAQALMAEGYNVILDTTMGNNSKDNDEPSVMEDFRDLLEHGYEVHAMFIDTEPGLARERQKRRHFEGFSQRRTGKNKFGGRPVPEHVTRKSRARENFMYAVLNQALPFENFKAYDGNTETPVEIKLDREEMVAP